MVITRPLEPAGKVKGRVHAFAKKMEDLGGRSTLGRFVFLDRSLVRSNRVLTILGYTLFPEIVSRQTTGVGNRLIDFKQIHEWTVCDHIAAHRSDVKWLTQQVCELKEREPRRSIAIFTRHSPTIDIRAVDPWQGSSSVLSGFRSDPGDEACCKSEAVAFWGFGHTHFSCDFVQENGQRVAANQKGYKDVPQEHFNAGRVYIIGLGNARRIGRDCDQVGGWMESPSIYKDECTVSSYHNRASTSENGSLHPLDPVVRDWSKLRAVTGATPQVHQAMNR